MRMNTPLPVTSIAWGWRKTIQVKWSRPQYSTVEKNNSQYREHSPRSLASCRMENQRCCFRARGTLSCRHLDPISRRRRRYFRNAWGEWVDIQSHVILLQGVWPFRCLQHPTPKIQGEHQRTELGRRKILSMISCSYMWIVHRDWLNQCFSELFPGLIHLCESPPRRWKPEQWASTLCEARQQDILLQVKSFGCESKENWGNILRIHSISGFPAFNLTVKLNKWATSWENLPAVSYNRIILCNKPFQHRSS